MRRLMSLAIVGLFSILGLAASAQAGGRPRPNKYELPRLRVHLQDGQSGLRRSDFSSVTSSVVEKASSLGRYLLPVSHSSHRLVGKEQHDGTRTISGKSKALPDSQGPPPKRGRGTAPLLP